MQMSYYSDTQLHYVKTHFGMDVPSMDDLHLDIDLYLINSHYSLNEIRSMNPNMIEVAGLHLKDNDDPLSPVRRDQNDHMYTFKFSIYF